MHGNRVGGTGTGEDTHRAAVIARGVAMGMFAGHQDHRRRAITDRAAVHHVDRGGDQRRTHIVVERDRFLKHGVGVVGTIFVGVDAKASKGIQRQVKFIHVALHQERIQRYKADTVHRFVLGVGGGGETGGGIFAHGVGHLFHASHNHTVVKATGNRHDAGAQRGTATGAGSLDLGGFDASQPAVISDQRCQMFLFQQCAAQHIADVECIGILNSGIRHCRRNRIRRNLARRAIPQFPHRRLPNANNRNTSHENKSLLVLRVTCHYNRY